MTEDKRYTEEDIYYMQYAIQLAQQGKGYVNPNPLVGAVIVKNGKIIGEGWHEQYGGLHAERNAFKNCTESPEGATLYVTLEPCCHYGKTPPCTEAVIENKIARVVIGLIDCNPLVCNKGVKQLEKAGIEVVTGLEELAIREQNKVFIKYITTGMPWVTLKTAMTLDGKIATYTGNSKWVTGEQSRLLVHELRANLMGIMVGANTVKVDNPMLDCRLPGVHRQPVRIIVDSQASLSLDSRVVITSYTQKTIVAHTCVASLEKIEQLQRLGVETLLCEEKEGHVSLTSLLQQLGKMGIDSILLEGGGELNYSFLQEKLVDEVYAFIAPKIIGGRTAPSPVEGDGIDFMDKAIELQNIQLERIGNDILIKGK
ncbi:MAG: bifunctional diaminohydroxyphosphoribosylaminopyrimidine deaminase/5-amino-6-(5-phosphoribosylamino)uracil reductase RibD [Odoribacter sp.]|nr:bifunctional diaminohydroxyphosphoribosylaminopyrimidine deaminase/5-amino-6-(5-phosphoribosylamino)uracil reductase RibD [Odoribacter sp.]